MSRNVDAEDLQRTQEEGRLWERKPVLSQRYINHPEQHNV